MRLYLTPPCLCISGTFHLVLVPSLALGHPTGVELIRASSMIISSPSTTHFDPIRREL